MDPGRDGLAFYFWNVGMAFYARGELLEAIDYLSKAKKQNMETSDLFRDCGKVRLLRNEFDLALKDFESGLQISPDDIKLRCLKGACLIMQNLIDAAEFHFSKIVHDAPTQQEYVTAFRQRWLSYANSEQQLGLFSYISNYLWGHPSEKMYTAKDSRLPHELKSHPLFTEDHQPPTNETLARLFAKLGALYFSRKDYANSMHYFRKSLAYNNRDYRVWHDKSVATVYNGLVGIALKDAEEGLKLNPNDASLVTQKGVCYLLLRKIDDASIFFKKALTLDSKKKDWYRGVAVSWLEHVKLEDPSLSGIESLIEELEVEEHKDGDGLRRRHLLYSSE